MSVWGALNNANTNTNADANGIAILAGGTFPVGGGTLNSVAFYMQSISGGGNWRVGVYSGGAASDANGATKLWDSGVLNNNFAAAGWQTVTVSGSPSLPSAGRVWVAVMSEVCQRFFVVAGADNGDLDADYRYYLDTIGGFAVNNAATALPGPITAAPSGGAGTPLKFYFDYTPAGTSGSSGGPSSATAQGATYVVNPNIVVAPRRNVFVNDVVIQY